MAGIGVRVLAHPELVPRGLAQVGGGTSASVADPAPADAQVHVKEILQDLKSRRAAANRRRRAEIIQRLEELGELGPDAASAVPFLLSDEFYVR